MWTSSNLLTPLRKEDISYSSGSPSFAPAPFFGPPQALPPSTSTLPGLPQHLVGLSPHLLRHCYLHRRLGRLNASLRADGTPWQHSSLRGPDRKCRPTRRSLLSRGTSNLRSATRPSSATPERRAPRVFSATVVTPWPLATPEHSGSCSFMAHSILALTREKTSD